MATARDTQTLGEVGTLVSGNVAVTQTLCEVASRTSGEVWMTQMLLEVATKPAWNPGANAWNYFFFGEENV